MRVLILGGTGEARALATLLAADGGFDVVSSLAGRVADPLHPPGGVRTGGFGGAEGLSRYLVDERVDRVVDATHPFAARMTAHAVTAAGAAGVPLAVLRRPGWRAGPGDRWCRVPSVAAAAALVTGTVAEGGVVLLTLGRGDVEAFAGDAGRHYVVRSIDPPGGPLPPRHTVVLARGPFSPAGERSLLGEHGVDLVVSRASGGDATAPKLAAAREAGLAVVLVDRPPLPQGVTRVTDAAAARDWLRHPAGQSGRGGGILDRGPSSR